jgi:hypothetical protein
MNRTRYVIDFGVGKLSDFSFLLHFFLLHTPEDMLHVAVLHLVRVTMAPKTPLKYGALFGYVINTTEW